jgi:plastocyanin
VSFAISPRLPLIAGFAGLSLALVALALAARSASAADVSVEAGNNYFCSVSFDGSVCETDITAGDTVTWSVVAGSHTVTECSAGFAACPPSGGFDSGILIDGDTFSHTYNVPGTYPYRCELHTSEMLGTIVVAAATPSPSPTPTSIATTTEAPSISPTAVVLPKTGGAPSDAGYSWQYALLGVAALAASGAAFAVARRRETR